MADNDEQLRERRDEAEDPGEAVIPAGPRQNQQAATVAVARASGTPLHLPFAGDVTLPPAEHLAYYAAIAALAAVEVIEWPLAVLLGVGKMLADNHRNRALQEFGKALDETP